MTDIPVIIYSTKTRLIDNQIQFIVGSPMILAKATKIEHSWHYGTGTIYYYTRDLSKCLIF